MRRFGTMIVVAAIALGGLFAFAEDKPKAAAAAPTQEQMMAAMMKAAALAPEHETLKAMAGKFDVEVKAYEAPGAPPETSKGKSTNELILGGRYLKGDFTGSMMNMPFHGLG